jgi:hypothetical protein
MKVEQETDDLVAIAALRLALESCTPEELMLACQDGNAEALDTVCRALPALRRRAGLSIAEFMGRDLAGELGLEVGVVH